MCHQNLKINFGENVNFVIGRNGSGKSAIMTGIVVGLGGCAAHTNRAQSLKGLIKKGCPSATVTVCLRNSGCDAFHEDRFGKCVIVERRIAVDGGGHYKIKNHEGKIVSTKKEDLLHVLDHFNIQVSNPVSLLNQDTSRNFLHSSKPADKYKLFMKATQLEQLKVDYQLILEQRDTMTSSLELKRAGLPDLQKEVVQWEEKFKNLAQLDELAASKQQLEQEIAWAQVIGLEKERTKLARDVEKKERSIPKYTKKVEDCKAEVEKGETSIHELEEELKIVNCEAAELQKRHKAVQDDLKKMKDACGKAKRELYEISHECRGEERVRSELQKRMAELTTTSMKSRENEKMIRKVRKQELHDEVGRLQSEMAEEQRQKTNLESTIHRKTEQQYEIQRKIEDSRRQVERCERELSGLERNRGNKLQVYGDWMPRLVNAIDKEHGFHKKPYGPLGRYIKLNDEKWALAAETVLGPGLLAAFCCHDQYDLQLLRRLVATHCPRDRQPHLIKQTFRDQPYDVSTTQPRCDQPTFFDIVECSEPVVFNALIDQRGVESVLMIEKSDVATRVMHVNTPRGAREAFTQSGDQVLGGGTNRYYSCPQNKARLVQQSVEGRIVGVREQRDELQRSLQQLQQEKRGNDEEKKRASRECDQVKVQLHRKEHQINQIRGELQELDLADDEVSSVDIAGLEEELEEHNDRIGILTQQSQTLTEQYEEMQHQYDEQKAGVDAEKGKAKETLDKMEQIKGGIERLAQTVSEAKGHQSHYEKKLNELMEDIAGSQRELDTMETRVRESTGKAEMICERIETQKTVKELENKLNQIERVIAEEEERQGSREEIVTTYHELSLRYTETKKATKSLQLCLKRLSEMMTRRVKQLQDYRHSVAMRIKVLFQLLLQQRGYNGKMMFNHGNKELKLEVQVAETDKSAMTKDMKALSGGERSFTTVCFILSLWGIIESPFRMLDEFDVFMDMVNRRVSMAMLLKAAREQPNKQFVFLTPQDLSAHIGAPDVRTHRLHDPERHQSTLNFDRAGSSRGDD